MPKVLKWCQARKQIVQRVSNLTISTKPLDQDNSKFYSKLFIKLPTTFVLNYFLIEQLKMVEQLGLDRLLRVKRFGEGYYKFENTRVGSFKIFQNFTEDL